MEKPLLTAPCLVPSRAPRPRHAPRQPPPGPAPRGATASRRPALAAALAFVASLLASGAASASANYPAVVQDYFALDQAPACTLCHASADGGSGQVNGFVGWYLEREVKLGAGLGAEALESALFRWNAAQDSDGDKVTDRRELLANSDPNDPSSVPGSPRDEGAAGTDPVGAGGGGQGGGDGGDEDASGDETAPPVGGCSYADSAARGGDRGAALLVGAGLLSRLLARRRRRSA